MTACQEETPPSSFIDLACSFPLLSGQFINQQINLMNEVRKFFSRRERIILLALGLLALIGYPVVRAWQTAQVALPQIPCQQQIQEIDAILAQLTNSIRVGLTNFAPADALKPYTAKGVVPHCPEGGVIKMALDGALTTYCSKHGAIMQPAPKPSGLNPVEAVLQSIGLIRIRIQPNRNACIANLKQMDGAAQQWALENRKEDKDEIDVMGAASYLKGGTLPTCPQGGKYWFTVVSNPPCCTITGHSLP